MGSVLVGELACCVLGLKFEELVYLYLCPDEMGVLSCLIHDLPPEPPLHDAADEHRIIARTHKQFVLRLNLIPKLDIESIPKIDLPQEILVTVKLLPADLLNIHLVGLSHAEYKVLLLHARPLSLDIFLDPVEIAYEIARLARPGVGGLRPGLRRVVFIVGRHKFELLLHLLDQVVLVLLHLHTDLAQLLF